MENFNYSKFRGAICVPFCIFNNKINGNIQGIDSRLIRGSGYTSLEVSNDDGTLYRMQLSANGGLVHLYENSGSGWYQTDSLALKSDFVNFVKSTNITAVTNANGSANAGLSASHTIVVSVYGTPAYKYIPLVVDNTWRIMAIDSSENALYSLPNTSVSLTIYYIEK